MPHWWLRDIDVFDQFLQIWKIPANITWWPADQKPKPSLESSIFHPNGAKTRVLLVPKHAWHVPCIFLRPSSIEPRWNKKNPRSLSLRNMSRWNAKGILPEYAAWICFFCFKTTSYKFQRKQFGHPEFEATRSFKAFRCCCHRLGEESWKWIEKKSAETKRLSMLGTSLANHTQSQIPYILPDFEMRTFVAKKYPFQLGQHQQSNGGRWTTFERGFWNWSVFGAWWWMEDFIQQCKHLKKEKQPSYRVFGHQDSSPKVVTWYFSWGTDLIQQQVEFHLVNAMKIFVVKGVSIWEDRHQFFAIFRAEQRDASHKIRRYDRLLDGSSPNHDKSFLDTHFSRQDDILNKHLIMSKLGFGKIRRNLALWQVWRMGWKFRTTKLSTQQKWLERQAKGLMKNSSCQRSFVLNVGFTSVRGKAPADPF